MTSSRPIQARRTLWRGRSTLALAAIALAACSGGPKVASPANVGGPDQTETVVVTGPSGVTVTVPPGAIDVPITIAIAPALDAGTIPAEFAVPAGPAFEITPHGATFSRAVTVRLPYDAAGISGDAQLVVLEADPGGPWTVHTNVSRDGDSLLVEVEGFSVFKAAALAPGRGTVALPLGIEVEPVELASFTLSIPGQGYTDVSLHPRPTPVPLAVRVTGNVDGCLVQMGQSWREGPMSFRIHWAELAPAGPGERLIVHMGTPEWSRAEWRQMNPVSGTGEDYRLFGYNGRLHCSWTTATGASNTLDVLPSNRTIIVSTDFPDGRVGFTRIPAGTAVEVGQRAGFSVHVVGGTADPSIPNEILWLRSDDEGGTWVPVAFSEPAPDNEDGLYPDDELNWYYTPPVTASDDGALIRVRACATGPAFSYLPGSPVAQHDCQYSAAARLTVISDAAPFIVTEPSSAIVDPGQPATYSVVVAGVPAPTLQWQRRDPGSAAWVDVGGATDASYTTPPAAAAQSESQFRVVATNRAGVAWSRTVLLLVRPPPELPVFTEQPQPRSVALGASVTFSALAQVAPLPTYQWRHDGVAIPGATGRTFDIPVVTLADAGLYSVVASNAAGSVTSDDALLTVTVSGVLASPVVTVGYGIKQVLLSWPAVPGASTYRVWKSVDGVAPPVQLGGDLTGTSLAHDVSIHQERWGLATYQVEACNAGGCAGSTPVTAPDQLQAIGSVKASNTGEGDSLGCAVALSADGATLAVSACYEASAATGVDGDQGDDGAPFAGAVYVYTRQGGGWSQQAYLKASNTDANDQFGCMLALSADGSTLAASACNEASAAMGIGGDQADDTAPGAGAVYVFTRSGASWSQQAYLKGSNTEAGDGFGGMDANISAPGHSVSLSADGNTLAVGAWNEGSAATGVGGDQADDGAVGAGAAYLFTRSGTGWTQEAYLKASNTEGGDRFGCAVGLSGDGTTLAVGACWESGASAGVDGDQASNAAPRAGAVYVFVKGGGAWSQQAYLKASNPDGTRPPLFTGDTFGVAVSLSGDGSRLAVSAPMEASGATGVDGDQADDGTEQAGAVYLFARGGGTWAQEAYLKASNPMYTDRFGSGLALSTDGATLAVGARSEGSQGVGVGADQADYLGEAVGAAYLFSRSAGAWTQGPFVKPPNSSVSRLFGSSVALSADGSTLAVGASAESSGGSGVSNVRWLDSSMPLSGSAYLY